MILDTINNLSNYRLNTKIPLTVLQDYINSNKLNLFKKGKFEIKKDVFFGIGLLYETKEEKDCLWEAHKKHLDIHVIIEGQELVNVADISAMKQTMDFDYVNDYQLFEGDKQQTVMLKKDDVLILYPNECHQTSVKVQETTLVKKVVFKIKLN